MKKKTLNKFYPYIVVVLIAIILSSYFGSSNAKFITIYGDKNKPLRHINLDHVVWFGVKTDTPRGYILHYHAYRYQDRTRTVTSKRNVPIIKDYLKRNSK